MTLHAIIAGKPTVLIFYRGSWCPYCNAHLSDLVTVEDELRSLGYQIVAISPDRPEELNPMMTADHLNYRLFSDPQAEAMKKFGVAYRLDDTTVTNYKQKYNVDLERSSGQTHHILPVPAVFILDRTGKIVFVHADPDYTARMKGAEVLAAAKTAATTSKAVSSIFSDPDKFVKADPFPFLLTALIVFAFGAGRLSVDALLKWGSRKIIEKRARVSDPNSVPVKFA